MNSSWGKTKEDIDNRIYLEMQSWAASTRALEGEGFEVGQLGRQSTKKPGRHSEQLESIEKKKIPELERAKVFKVTGFPLPKSPPAKQNCRGCCLFGGRSIFLSLSHPQELLMNLLKLLISQLRGF